MTSANRATRIGKLHTLLKKAYKPTLVSENRPLMEHLLYACLLENVPYELADEALARLEQEYFDWNEVRVTTITELAEVLSRLPDPTSAALRLKKNLHGLFESTYTFDLEELRKQNLGKALQKFEKLPAMTPFVLSYLTQHGLGGHAIPLDSAALRYFWLSDIINESELKTGKVTGLERAIPKSKGLEFASLLHQAAVALNIDPNDDAARDIVLTLNPELDQKVADHVAAVKQRRVAKAIAAAEAEAAESEAETEAAKGKPAKSGKNASKSSEKSAPKSSGKPSAKSAAKTEAKPAKTAATKEHQGEADARPADSKLDAAKGTAARSSKSKGSSKSAPPSDNEAGEPAVAAGNDAVKDSKAKKSEGGSKKSSKKAAAAEPAKKAVEDDASPESPEDAVSSSEAKTSSKKISKRKPR